MKFAEKVSSEQLEGTGPWKDQKFGIKDLLRGKVLRRNTMIITFIWFTTMGVYVGLSYYAPALGGDEYLNFFLAGLAELPTYFFLFPLLDHWGRRWTLFSSLVLGGIACIFTIVIKERAWLTLTLYCIGKFGISAGFVAIQQMALEIYPTVIRGLGISFSNVVGMIGPALVPLVNYTGQEYLYLPLLTLGALMVLGGMAALGLPETLGRSLPQTLADAEQFQVDCSIGSCYPTKTKRKQTFNSEKSCKNDATETVVSSSGPTNSAKELTTFSAEEESRRHISRGRSDFGGTSETVATAIGIPMSSTTSFTQRRHVDEHVVDHDHHKGCECCNSQSFHEFDKKCFRKDETTRAYPQVSDIETTQVFLEQKSSLK